MTENTEITLVRRIELKLEESIKPLLINVINESDKHAGHHGSPGTGESHFRLKIVAEAFAGLSRIERHRLVYDALAQEMSGGIHALAIDAKTPQEVE